MVAKNLQQAADEIDASIVIVSQDSYMAKQARSLLIRASADIESLATMSLDDFKCMVQVGVNALVGAGKGDGVCIGFMEHMNMARAYAGGFQLPEDDEKDKEQKERKVVAVRIEFLDKKTKRVSKAMYRLKDGLSQEQSKLVEDVFDSSDVVVYVNADSATDTYQVAFRVFQKPEGRPIRFFERKGSDFKSESFVSVEDLENALKR